MYATGSNCRVRFIADPFTGELGTQVKCHLRDFGPKRWDTWCWVGSSLRILMNNSTYQPRIYPMVGVQSTAPLKTMIR